MKRKPNSKICFIFLMLTVTYHCLAQSDSVKYNEVIYNKVYKNIAAYYIKYSINVEPNLRTSNLLSDDYNYFFDKCLPDEGYKLDMEITRLNWTYPIPGYLVYQIKINGFRFTNDKLKKTKVIQSYDGQLSQPPWNYYLLAINRQCGIKFISGTYFTHDISKDFKLDEGNPLSYIEYLKYKAFQAKISKLKFSKKEGRKIYFDAYSEELQSMVTLIINVKNPSNLEIKKYK